jgi:hypothetical protein
MYPLHMCCLWHLRICANKWLTKTIIWLKLQIVIYEWNLNLANFALISKYLPTLTARFCLFVWWLKDHRSSCCVGMQILSLSGPWRINNSRKHQNRAIYHLQWNWGIINNQKICPSWIRTRNCHFRLGVKTNSMLLP